MVNCTQGIQLAYGSIDRYLEDRSHPCCGTKATQSERTLNLVSRMPNWEVIVFMVLQNISDCVPRTTTGNDFHRSRNCNTVSDT